MKFDRDDVSFFALAYVFIVVSILTILGFVYVFDKFFT